VAKLRDPSFVELASVAIACAYNLTCVRSFVSAVATLPAFVALAILHTWPLARHLDTHLPGLALGDNVSFVWNLWWMREALASADVHFFITPFLMAPLGTPLVLHTHTAALAWIGATVLAPLTVVAAQNVLLIGSIALNGWSVSLLTQVLTRHRVASLLAGLMFLMSPVIAPRLMGHYNLVAVWPLVFPALAFVVWWRRFDRASGIGLGIAAGLLPWFDYYLSVYFLIFVLSYGAASVIRVEVTRTRVRSLGLALIGAVIVAVAAVAIAATIAMATTEVLVVLGVRISARSPTNALTVAWLAGLVAVCACWRWHVVFRQAWPRDPRDVARAAILPVVVAALLLSPLIPPVWRLRQSGGYVTQQSGLRSGPRGVDLATLVIGPPFHGAAGPPVRDAYRRFGIDTMEGSAYVGWVGLVLAAWSVTRRREEPGVREWGGVLGVFAVMGLGPYLMMFGRNTGLLLPAAVLRLIPLVNNARIPGRALIVAAVAAAVLSAFAFRSLWVRSRVAVGGLAVLLVGESLAAPLPLSPLPSPGVYGRVAADPTGAAVLPVPFGVRDGFRELGRVEPDAILQQMVHQHPIVGGFVARLQPSIPAWYQSHEPFATLLRLSAGDAAASALSCETSREGLQTANVGWVVVYNDASGWLRQSLAALPLERIDADGQRALYRVTGC